jgi:hypothetical protein
VIDLMSFISPTPKRTQGRAPCGALSLLQKTLNYRGDPAETAATLNVKLLTSVTARWWCLVVAGYPLLSPILFSNLFEPSRTILNLRLENLSREF